MAATGTQVVFLQKKLKEAGTLIRNYEQALYMLQADISFTESVGCAFAWDLGAACEAADPYEGGDGPDFAANYALHYFEQALKEALAPQPQVLPVPEGVQ